MEVIGSNITYLLPGRVNCGHSIVHDITPDGRFLKVTARIHRIWISSEMVVTKRVQSKFEKLLENKYPAQVNYH